MVRYVLFSFAGISSVVRSLAFPACSFAHSSALLNAVVQCRAKGGFLVRFRCIACEISSSISTEESLFEMRSSTAMRGMADAA